MTESTGWTVDKSADLYALPSWGQGYFRVNKKGNVEAVPDPARPTACADLQRLISDLKRRGIPLPLLVRFDGILRHRVEHLFGCFGKAIGAQQYQGRFRGVYPIKVNQQRHVVEVLLNAGRRFGLGLEVGSKPELLAVLAILDDPNALLICNGYKDRAFLETALLATKIGRNPIVVVERAQELEELIEVSRDLGIRPVIGLRVKLATRGAGRWESSGGERSKFGLSTREIVAAVDLLKKREMLDCLQLLHFHLGSQITAISNIKKALREGTRLFVELHRLGAPMKILDVGGGLGVDYDGTKTNFMVSTNYSDQEYANDVVAIVRQTCDEAGVPHPDLVSESGRALVAHHSLLVVDVIGASTMIDHQAPSEPKEDRHPVLRELWKELHAVHARNHTEVFHNVHALKEEALTLFHHGLISLEDRAHAEEIAAAAFAKVLRFVQTDDVVPEEFEHLERDLSDTVYCNFSIFQSLPDCWAIKHTFPVMPLQDLDQRPQRKAVLADITCDSDGKIDKFIGTREIRDTLDLHAVDSSRPYTLGFFLVGAYQEILGDVHNLFGDTAAVHVEVAEDGEYEILHLVEGDTIGEVLSLVEYHQKDLLAQVRQASEKALRAGKLTVEESVRLLKLFDEGLEGYTYPA